MRNSVFNALLLPVTMVITSVLVLEVQSLSSDDYLLSMKPGIEAHVSRYALALVETPLIKDWLNPSDLSLTESLLRSVLDNNRSALPDAMTDVVVEDSGFELEGRDVTGQAELILKNRESVLIVFETDDQELYYAYVKNRPAFSDRQYARILRYPVFSIADHFTQLDVEVSIEWVSYVNPHHRTFKNHG